MSDKPLIEQLMVPLDLYPMVHPEDTILEAAFALRESFCEMSEGVCSQAGLRCAMVVDDDENLTGFLDFNCFWESALEGMSRRLTGSGPT